MKKIMTAAAASAIVLLSLHLPAFAAGTVYSSALVTDDAHKTTTFDKYLVMDAKANVPNAVFTFEIEAGGAVDAGDGTLAVLAGIGTPKLNDDTDGNADIEFTSRDTAAAESSKPDNEAPVFKTPDTSDEKYVKKTLTLDFSGIAYPEPGVYRYLLTESGTNQGIVNGYESDTVTETVRTLDVYVEDAGTTAEDGKPQLKITGYVIYDGAVSAAPKASLPEGKTETDVPNGAEPEDAEKSSGITNLYETQNLTFSKTVTGNQGSKDKYFKFTVKIENAVAGTVYDVDLSQAEAAPAKNAATVYDPMTNPDSITVPAEATSVEQDFYLQHGQSITILGLAKGSQYTITETPEDYTASAEAAGADTKTGEKAGSEADITLDSNAMRDDYMQGDAEIAYTNNREGVIPTGILLSTAAPLLFCAAMAGVLTVLIIRRATKKEDQ